VNYLRLAIAACAVWLLVILALETLGTAINPALENPVTRAEVDMTWGLVLLWVVAGGGAMYLLRDRAKSALARLGLGPRMKFFILATGLILVEETVTTGMTNLAPEFGVKVGQAYITASSNYLHVILFHSAVVIVPMFAAWALLLGRFSFDQKAVMLIYGVTGLLAESVSFGLQNLQGGGLWILVYGLMVYLPAFCVTPIAGSRRPGARAVLLALALPLLFGAIAAVLVLLVLHPPAVEFGSNG
jgi:hypothetical protein